MIDTAFERWAAREAAQSIRDAPMLAAGLDPRCKGCRVHFDTGGRYMASHTCQRGIEDRQRYVLGAYERARGTEFARPRSPKRKVAPSAERLRAELRRLAFVQQAMRAST